jgi:hypothetical protein
MEEFADSFTLRQERLYTTDMSMDTTLLRHRRRQRRTRCQPRPRRARSTQRSGVNMLVCLLPRRRSGCPACRRFPPASPRLRQHGDPAERVRPVSTVKWMVDVLLHGPRTLGARSSMAICGIASAAAA